MRHRGCMKAYSEDLRRKVVEAVEHRGMGKRAKPLVLSELASPR
jgi:hypothetical protein